MISLPKPMSQRPTGMPQQRRKSSLRTAAGAVQEQFLARIADLRDDPTRILPECLQGEPKTVRKLRRQLEAIKAGRTPLAARFDRHLLGAVHKAIPLAKREAVPRMLDAKIAGQRRFYIQRGQVNRICSLAVQNFDEPRVLIMGYGSMAKRHGLHFFAGDRLWCSGSTPNPPQAWIDEMAETANTRLEGDATAGWSCPHPAQPRVMLTWRSGPALACCAECGRRAGGMHKRIRDGYLGPRVRQPVEVDVMLPDGSRHAVAREPLARYRAGVATEADLCGLALAAWRNSGGRRWVLGDRTFASAAAFADALAPEPWERDVLADLLSEGYVAANATVASVLEARRDRVGVALRALLDDGPAFARARPGVALRDLVRAAHEEARRRAAAGQLATPTALGPQGQWIDALARAHLGNGRPAALALLREAAHNAPVPRTTVYAFLYAVGGALDLEARFTPDEKAAAQPLVPLARQLLDARGDAYVTVLAEFLRITGSGEEPR